MRRRKIARMALLAVVGIALVVVAAPADSVNQDAQNNGEVEVESLNVQPAATSGSCGVERWSVKTGTDADNGKITLQQTTNTTVASLRSLPKPSTLPSSNRIQPTETTVFRLQSTLTKYKLENDSDYHLVLDDGNGQTMIVEVPDPACTGSSSPLLASIQKARAEVNAKYTVTSSFQNTSVPVTVTGVGFFDFLHGQTGVAPNGIELHALLDIQFGTGSGGTVSVVNPGNQNGAVGTPANLQMSATDTAGGTLTYSATGLPAGLSINPATGLIAGTPTAAGSSTVTVTATDSTGPSGTTSFTWAVTGGSGGCTPAQLLGNPGFETGTAAPWTDTGVLNNATSEPAHTGAWDARLNGYGSAHTDTLAQTVTLPTGCAAYNLGFWLHIDTAEPTTSAYDTLAVQLLDSSGTVLSALATYSNRDAASGYVQRSFDLSAYAGRTVTLKFTGTEDYTKQTSFVLDDTAINVS